MSPRSTSLDDVLKVVRDLGREMREARFAFYRERMKNPHEPPIWLGALPRVDDLRNFPRDAVAFACSPKTKGFQKLPEFTNLEALLVYTMSNERMPLLAPLTKISQLMLKWATFTSFQPLASLAQLQALVVEGNSKIASLETLRAVSQLRTLLLHDFRRLPRLDGIECMQALTGLVIECGYSGGLRVDLTVDSLAPLRGLTKLRLLRLNNVHVRDDDLSPLADMAPNTQVEISGHCYPLEQLALVAAKHRNCYDAWRQPQPMQLRCRKCSTQQVFVIGRGNRRMCPTCSASQVNSIISEFERLVARFGRS